MLIAFTARDVLHIFVVGPTVLLLLYWVWPWLLARSIRANYDGSGGWLYRNVSNVLVGLLFLFAFCLFLALVWGDDKRGLWDTEAALTAIAVAAGVSYGYIRLIAPAFWPAFLPVDPETGAWNNVRETDLTIRAGRPWPIFIVVHNTSIAPWGNYRITVEFKGVGNWFRIDHERDDVPISKIWGWKTKELRIIPEQFKAQVQAGNTLAVGESQTIRFLVTAPSPGRFTARISMVCDGRLGESRRELPLNVVE